MATKRIAVIFGAGPGTGAAVARALAPTHSLLLLSRSLPGSLPKLALDVPDDRVLAATFDGTGASLHAAVAEARAKWAGAALDVAICNTGGTWAPGSFLERSTDDLKASLDSCVGAWDFAQSVMPPLLEQGGTLIFTGATMAMRGGAKFSAMAPGMWARRALAQSLAREFGPRGVHVAHVIIDGQIETDRVKDMGGAAAPGSRLRPEDIAKTYLALIDQSPSAWTQEMDLSLATK